MRRSTASKFFPEESGEEREERFLIPEAKQSPQAKQHPYHSEADCGC